MRIITTFLATALLGIAAPAYSQVAFSEDFEGVTVPALPTDWASKTTDFDGGGWKTYKGALTFPGTNTDWMMPARDNVVLLNDWGGTVADTNNPANLITPLIDMSTLATPYLFMEYYFVNARSGTNTESLNILASLDTGKTWTNIKNVTAGDPYKWQELYVDLKAYKGEDGIMFAVSYADGRVRLIGAAVDNIKVFDPPPNNVKMLTVTPAPRQLSSYALAGTKQNIAGTYINNGSDTIKTLVLHYQVESDPIVSDTLRNLSVAPFTTAAFTSPTQFTHPATLDDYKVKVWLELDGDIDLTNDSGNTAFTTVMYFPDKKILAEEGTGTWCGWCPRGHVFMDSIAASATHKNAFSLIAVHNQDPMAVTNYDAKMRQLIGGYPSMSIDRRIEADPDQLFNVYNSERSVFAFADVTLTHVPVPGFAFSVKVDVKTALNLEGDYRLALAISEDDVRGPAGTAWDQVNYYSYEYNNVYLVGSGIEWHKEPKAVSADKMHYNHVARVIYPGPDGAQGSLPATMTAGNTYSYTFNVPTQPYWQRDGKKLHAIVMLIRNIDGHVLNTNNLTVPVGISDVNAGVTAFTIYPNPTASKAVVNFTQANAGDVDIVVTDMMGRLVQTISKDNMSAGEHKVNIDLSGVTAGIYNVTVKTETGSVTTRLSVVK